MAIYRHNTDRNFVLEEHDFRIWRGLAHNVRGGIGELGSFGHGRQGDLFGFRARRCLRIHGIGVGQNWIVPRACDNGVVPSRKRGRNRGRPSAVFLSCCSGHHPAVDRERDRHAGSCRSCEGWRGFPARLFFHLSGRQGTARRNRRIAFDLRRLARYGIWNNVQNPELERPQVERCLWLELVIAIPTGPR